MNLLDIKNMSSFHDSKMGEIIYDYRNKKLTIELDMDSKLYKGMYLLNAYDVKYFCSEVIEPWGKGIYLIEVEYIIEETILCVSLKLNSGDNIQFNALNVSLDAIGN